MFLLAPAYPGCPGQTAVKWCSGIELHGYDLTDVDRYCHVGDDKTARLGFKPKLGVLQQNIIVFDIQMS